MSFKEICLIGAKILAGLSAGLLVFFGLTGKKKTVEPQENTNQSITVTSSSSEAYPVIDGLQKAQDVCGKTLSVIQTLTAATESLSRVFNGEPNVQNQMYGYGCSGNPWSYNQPVNMGNGQVWNRISPYIVEVPNTRPYGNNNAYVGPNGGYPI